MHIKIKARTVVKIYVVWQLCRSIDTFVAGVSAEFVKGLAERGVEYIKENV